MITNDTYRVAHELLMAGRWNDALDQLDDAADPKVRADILVERALFTQTGTEEAEVAVDALPAGTNREYLRAQLAYQRLLFGHAYADDEDTVRIGLDAAEADPALRGWVGFYRGVFAENIANDPDAARTHYESAFKVCRADNDLLLESYVVRHLGGLAIDGGDQRTGEDLLRRSLHLRAALGARPLTAAAQATLATFLPDGPERDTLREASAYAGRELGIPWL